MKTILAAILVVLVGCSKPEPEAVSVQEAPPPAPDPQALPEGAVWLPGCSNSIVPPVQFTQWDVCDDGGTLLFKFVDSRTNEYTFCSDGQIRSTTPGDFYFGANHPRRAGARRLPRGSQFESDLITLISEWLSDHEKTEESEEIVIRLNGALVRHKKTQDRQQSSRPVPK